MSRIKGHVEEDHSSNTSFQSITRGRGRSFARIRRPRGKGRRGRRGSIASAIHPLMVRPARDSRALPAGAQGGVHGSAGTLGTRSRRRGSSSTSGLRSLKAAAPGSGIRRRTSPRREQHSPRSRGRKGPKGPKTIRFRTWQSLMIESDMELGELGIERLPELCVAHAISLASPRDACRLSAVSAAFRCAATSDTVWDRFLPTDWQSLVSRAVYPVEFSSSSSKRDIFFRLCDPILIDDGKMVRTDPLTLVF
ncbi:hypothetical protein GW17_00017839 [Ensete ventricosum]|nr:hypothetical protein GW17_00017839 [Ensete ventricosum]RZS11008.1 hypothetical protein BHM03_00042292 [Ensete ventricosum]